MEYGKILIWLFYLAALYLFGISLMFVHYTPSTHSYVNSTAIVILLGNTMLFYGWLFKLEREINKKEVI
ncbi:MAG: hypothetical protein DRG35_01415 [Deltaproteobacteria bacterium]|nr:MAG: hypothetical protein DRG35_01415 [Deltaproteobacteria bacterium]